MSAEHGDEVAYAVCMLHLRDQLLRASSSVALNLAEGSEGVTDRNRRRFYRMAMASLRESQAILNLISSMQTKCAEQLADEAGACIFGLIRAIDKKLTGTEGTSREP